MCIRDRHYHTLKDETFYLQSGKIQLSYSPVSSAFPDDRDKAETITLEPGDAFHCTRGTRHQMLALEDAELFEFSTQHFDSDSNRVIPGD